MGQTCLLVRGAALILTPLLSCSLLELHDSGPLVPVWLSSIAPGLQQLVVFGGCGPPHDCPVIRGVDQLQALTAPTLKDTYLSAGQLEGLAQLPGLRELWLVRVERGFLTEGLHGLTRLTQLQLKCSDWQCLRSGLASAQDIADIVAQVWLPLPGRCCSGMW